MIQTPKMATRADNADTNADKTKFSSTLSMYLTLLGYSLSTADIWRFPFLLYRNGGGAFLIPFVITICVCGIPLYFLEYSVAKFSGKGPYAIWDVSPLFRGASASIMAAYTLYIIGNTILRCWLLDFLFHSFKDPLPWTQCDNYWNTKTCRENSYTVTTKNHSVINSSLSQATLYLNTSDRMAYDPISNNSSFNFTLPSLGGMSAAEEFWQFKVLELSSGVTDLYPVQWRYILTLFALRVIIFLCIIKSIKSIEKVMYFTTLVPIILTVAIFVRSLLLPGSVDGIYHFFYPDFVKLQEPRVWIEAALMAFYTLAFGWGAIVMLGSHAQFRENCIRTSVLLPVIDTVMAMFTGLVCFSVLGNMAHAYNVQVTEVITAGMSTGIIAYVTALASLPLPQLWSVLFFSSTILTAMDTQMVPIDMIIQSIGEVFPALYPKYRTLVLAGFSILIFLLALPTCTGAGAYIFLLLDWYSGAWIGPIVAFVELVVFAWSYGIDRFSDDVMMMIGKPVPVMFRLCIAFLTPAVVLAIFLTSCIEYVDPQYGSYIYPAWTRVFGWLTVAGCMLPILVHAVYVILGDRGPLIKRVTRQLTARDNWGPCEDTEKAGFHEMKAKYKNRSLKCLFFYNLCGRYPTDAHSATTTTTDEEMACLGKH